MHTIDDFYQFYLQNFSDVKSELYQELNFHRKKALKFFSLGIIGLILLILFFVAIGIDESRLDSLSGNIQGLIIGSIVLFVIIILIFFGIGANATKKYKAIFKDRVIRKIIQFIDPSLKYHPNQYIGQSLFEFAKFFPNKSIDKYIGDDLVEGVIGKTHIKFSEIRVQEEHRSKNNKYYVDIFKGLFIIADFNKNFNGRTYVLPDNNDKRYARFLIFGERRNTEYGELVKLENPEFEKKFAVFSTDQIEARYILSTSLMERIVKLRNEIQKDVYFCFANSQIFIAIPYKKNLFEPKISKKVIEFELLKEYYEILLDTVEIVEELNLNTRIWTKE